MRLITGDECGLLKETIPELGRKKKSSHDIVTPYNSMPDVVKEGVSRIDPNESQKRNRGVIDMVWVDEWDGITNPDESCPSSSFSVLRNNGYVDFYTANVENKRSFGRHSLKYSTGRNVFGDNDAKPLPLGIGYFQQHNRLAAGDMFGNIVILDFKKKRKNNQCDVIQTYNAYNTNKGSNTISYTPGKLENSQLATAIAFDTSHGRVAVGGREREVCLVDILTGKLVFKTKNLPPDPQTLLQQPVWPSAIQFLNDDSNILAVGTAYKQVRLYDVRENTKTRRPTSLTPEDLLEYRITSLCQVNEHELVFGDAAGYIYSLDIRKMGRNSKGPANQDISRYIGPVGSIRQLKKHPTLPRLASVGLDRMLRVYDTKKRNQIDCVYLKQRLNCVLFHTNHIWDSTADTGCSSDENEDDENLDLDDTDLDQDDVVQDYVDSDDEMGSLPEDHSKVEIDDTLDSMGMEEDSDESSDESSSSDDDDDESQDSSSEEEQQPKRRRR